MYSTPNPKTHEPLTTSSLHHIRSSSSSSTLMQVVQDDHYHNQMLAQQQQQQQQHQHQLLQQQLLQQGHQVGSAQMLPPLQPSSHRPQDEVPHAPIPNYYQDPRPVNVSSIPVVPIMSPPQIAPVAPTYIRYPSMYESSSTTQMHIPTPRPSHDSRNSPLYWLNPRSKSDPYIPGSSSDPNLSPNAPQYHELMQTSNLNFLTEKDIKIIKSLLPMAETHKWKYLSHRLSKKRSKKISSEFTKVKTHDFFGLPYTSHTNNEIKYNIEGLVGSSVPYLVFESSLPERSQTPP